MKIKKNRVFVTRDYGLFGHITGNRTLTTGRAEKNINTIMNSMEKNCLPLPILVRADMSVVDGQNRLEALKRLKLPVPYIITTQDVSVEDIQRINNISNNWNTDDFLNSNMGIEKEKYPGNFHLKPYHLYEFFKKKYKFSHRNNLQMLCARRNIRDLEIDFKRGRLKIDDLQGAQDKADYITSFKVYIKEYRNRNFVTAFLAVMSHPRFSRRTWVKKMSQNSVKIVHCTNSKDYMKVINHVYNWGLQKKIRLLRKEELLYE